MAEADEPIGFAAANPSGSVLIAASEFAPFEGVTTSKSHARLCLNIGGLGSIHHRTAETLIEGAWNPGEMIVTMPGLEAECRTDRMDILGLAIDVEHLECEDCRIIALDLSLAAQSMTRDPMIASIMMALRHTAEAHGASGAFFDHGIALILERLAFLDGRPAVNQRPRALSPARLQRVRGFIDAHLATDIDVTELAREVGMSRSSFSRAFQISTGFTPFAYLTRERMRRAKCLIENGLAITEVALCVGYSNPSKFSQAFRRICGDLPSEWRAKR